MEFEIKLHEKNGINRNNEHVSFGIPLPQKKIFDCKKIGIKNSSDEFLNIQTTPLSHWPDGSIKWVLVDFKVNVDSNSTLVLHICLDMKNSTEPLTQIQMKDLPDLLHVDTGKSLFIINKKIFKPFSQVFVGDKLVSDKNQTYTFLTDISGNTFEPIIDKFSYEISGPLHSILKIEGFFGQRENNILRWIGRIHFFSDESTVRVDFTIWNPKPARHPGGLWDLGDPGSVLFKDLSIQTGITETHDLINVEWNAEFSKDFSDETCSSFSIYQGSSGGCNYRSKNHINRLGQIPIQIDGYQIVRDSELIHSGKRAEPVVKIKDTKNNVSISVKDFWKNFPKCIELNENTLTLSLFPDQFNDLFELQGGERKTHTFFMSFNTDTDQILSSIYPVKYEIDPSYIQYTNVFPYLAVHSSSIDPQYKELIDSIIIGDNNFFKRREIIDEYGWRNFGELYADHEAVGYKGIAPLISHYNNQYDFIYSAARQFAATGNSLWYELMDDLSRHVRDIDIYYTDKDRDEYNGGLLWHTDHYLDAATCTHRSASSKHLELSKSKFCGGGPAMEHNYTTGLMAHYFITGESASKEAVLSLVEWVVKRVEQPESFLAYLLKQKSMLGVWKKVFSGENVRYYSFPFTRETGNCITALLDAYTLTENKFYIEKAEEVIRSCIHPDDNIEIRNLFNTEITWSYTVCLQGIAKYLDCKILRCEYDEMFYYAKACLIKYAIWMADHEYPYLDKKEKLEYPNETWPAQDMRKSCVFFMAAKYAEPQYKKLFLDKALFYYTYSVNKVGEFETRSLTRPLVLLLQNGYLNHFYVEHPECFNELCNFTESNVIHKNNWVTRTSLLRTLMKDLMKYLFSFSLGREINWLKCRLYKHV